MQAVVDTLLISVPASELEEGSPFVAPLARLGINATELAGDPCELQVCLMPFGPNKAQMDDYKKYNGPPEGKALQRWVTDEVPNLVTRLDDPSLMAFMHTDPSGGRISLVPKILLFTNKDEAPGVFRALALHLKGRGNMAFAWVQVGSPTSEGIVEKFKPPRVPHLTAVMVYKDEEGNTRLGPQPYTGSLKFTAMRDFLDMVAKQVELAAGLSKNMEDIHQAMPAITDQEKLQTYCTAPAGMCMLALMDASSPDFEDDFKMMMAVARQQSSANNALHFAWLDARKYRAALQSFGLLSSDLPALVALSSKHMRFAAVTAAEDSTGGSRQPRLRSESVLRFVNEVLAAKIRTQPLRGLPEVIEGDAAAYGDGGGAAAADAAPVEEEFDLDDIMSEEVEGGAAAASKADRLKEIEEELEAEAEARKAAESAAKSSSKKKKKKSKKSKKSKKGAYEEL